MTNLARIVWKDQVTDLEYTFIQGQRVDAPLIIFLHEGLGSLSMWRDFPQQLCQALSCRGLVYSRPGYGLSSRCARHDKLTPDFMHEQAYDVLPKLLESLSIDPARDDIWLFGHSDGGSISLLFASHFTHHLKGCVVLAPHIFVEPITVQSIEQAKQNYLQTDLPKKLSKYHHDADATFWRWNDIWLDPEFLNWDIQHEISSITCPILAVQGLDDEYGTLEQIRGIKRLSPQTELLELAQCGHSPHRDQPSTLIDASSRFIKNIMET